MQALARVGKAVIGNDCGLCLMAPTSRMVEFAAKILV